MIDKNFFGKHLTLDCFHADKDMIFNIPILKVFLHEIVRLADMKVIVPAQVIYHEHENPLNSGCTGTIILADSLASIHTFKRNNFFSFDLFSCCDFSEHIIFGYIHREFKPKEIEQRVQYRGENFNR